MKLRSVWPPYLFPPTLALSLSPDNKRSEGKAFVGVEYMSDDEEKEEDAQVGVAGLAHAKPGSLFTYDYTKDYASPSKKCLMARLTKGDEDDQDEVAKLEYGLGSSLSLTITPKTTPLPPRRNPKNASWQRDQRCLLFQMLQSLMLSHLYILMS